MLAVVLSIIATLSILGQTQQPRFNKFHVEELPTRFNSTRGSYEGTFFSPEGKYMARAYSNGSKANENEIAKLINKYHIGGLIFSKGGPTAQAKLKFCE